MKKTLAILLALLAATSITLASCKEDKGSDLDDWTDDDNDYVDTGDETDDTDESDSKTNNDNSDNGNENNPSNNDNNGWSDASGNLYLGVNVTLRSQPSDSSSYKTDKNLYFGTALTRVRTNGRWEEVKVSGDDTLYYVKSIYTTTNSGNFTFTEATDTPALTLSETTNYNVCFYKSPFYSDDNDTNYSNMLCKGGIKANNLSEGYSLKKMAVSTNGGWVKVEFVGTVTISANNTATFTAENPGTFYIQALAFTRGDITGGGDMSGGNDSGNGDFFS